VTLATGVVGFLLAFTLFPILHKSMKADHQYQYDNLYAKCLVSWDAITHAYDFELHC
jgi:hypothetical protein